MTSPTSVTVDRLATIQNAESAELGTGVLHFQLALRWPVPMHHIALSATVQPVPALCRTWSAEVRQCHTMTAFHMQNLIKLRHKSGLKCVRPVEVSFTQRVIIRERIIHSILDIFGVIKTISRREKGPFTELSLGTSVPSFHQCQTTSGTGVQECRPVPSLRLALECRVPIPQADLDPGRQFRLHSLHPGCTCTPALGREGRPGSNHRSH